jgi:hypothetical protein
VISGALVLAGLCAVGWAIWSSMLQVLPAEGGGDGRRRRSVAGAGEMAGSAESHALAVEGDEPAVGDSNPVRITGQVGEHSVGSAKRPLGIDQPLDVAQCGEACLEGCRRGEGELVGKELEPPGLIGGAQPFQEQAAEEARVRWTPNARQPEPLVKV